MLKINDEFDQYLEDTKYINWKDPKILTKAQELLVPEDEIATVRKTFQFVRDEIKHSWDVQDRRVTSRATDVLHEKVGICWAKSNLLCALLRANHIPAGICYQRLTFRKNPDSGYCIHALNAVYLSSIGKWIRLDARGNKEGVNAQMNLTKEQLAFPVRENLGEIDYKVVYADSSPVLMKVLENSTDAIEMYLHALPASL